MRRRTPFWCAAVGVGVAAMLAVGASPAGAATIETESAWDGSTNVFDFGEPNTATYGQTFVAPGLPMASFRFHLEETNPGTPVTFDAYVMEWDGSKAAGSVLFSTGPITTTNNNGLGGFETIEVNTGALALTGGQDYVAFFSASDHFDGSNRRARFGWLAGNAYLGGEFVFNNNGGNFNDLTTTNWTAGHLGGGDLAFQMTFVPSPAAMGPGLMLLGMLGLTRRRRERLG